MLREFLKAKVHRVTITDANVNYEGSITLDENLMRASGIAEYEKVLIADINNGQRFETYVIKGLAGSGVACVNGAAAQLVKIGDLIIIMSYALLDEKESIGFEPTVVHVDSSNRQIVKK